MSGLLQQLGEIVAPTGIVTDSCDLQRFEVDGRAASGHAMAALCPSTMDELRSVVRTCFRAGVRLVVQGSNTGLVGAGVPDSSSGMVVLSLSKFKGGLDVDAANRSVTASAGILLSELNEASGKAGLYFPVDLGADPSVGGMVAANTGGARFISFGDVRRNVLGLEVVLFDEHATVLNLGGPLWKNNSAMDMKHLFIGTSGALGIVTKATFALQVSLTHRLTVMLALADDRCMLDLLARAEATFGPNLTAFEGISGAALDTTLREMPRLRNPFSGSAPVYAVLMELTCGALADEERLETVLFEMIEPLFNTSSAKVLDAVVDRSDNLWAIRHAIPEALRRSGRIISHDIALRRGDVVRFRERAAALVTDQWPQLQLCDFGHIGDGGLHFNFVVPPTAKNLPATISDDVRRCIFDLVVKEFGGSFSAEHGVGPSNMQFYNRYIDPNVRRLSGDLQKLISPSPIGRVDFAGNERIGQHV